MIMLMCAIHVLGTGSPTGVRFHCGCECGCLAPIDVKSTIFCDRCWRLDRRRFGGEIGNTALFVLSESLPALIFQVVLLLSEYLFPECSLILPLLTSTQWIKFQVHFIQS